MSVATRHQPNTAKSIAVLREHEQMPTTPPAAIAGDDERRVRKKARLNGVASQPILTADENTMTVNARTPTPTARTASPSGASTPTPSNGSSSPSPSFNSDWVRNTEMLRGAIDANSKVIDLQAATAAIDYFYAHVQEVTSAYLEHSRLGGTINATRRANSEHTALASKCKNIIKTWNSLHAAKQQKPQTTKTPGTVSSPMRPPATTITRTTTTPNNLSRLKPVTPVDKFRLREGFCSPSPRQLPVVVETSRSPSPQQPSPLPANDPQPASPSSGGLKLRVVRTAAGAWSSAPSLTEERKRQAEELPPVLEPQAPPPPKRTRIDSTPASPVSTSSTLRSTPASPAQRSSPTLGHISSKRQTARSSADLIAQINASLPEDMKLHVDIPNKSKETTPEQRTPLTPPQRRRGRPPKHSASATPVTISPTSRPPSRSATERSKSSTPFDDSGGVVINVPRADTPEQRSSTPKSPVKVFTRDWYNQLPPINTDLKDAESDYKSFDNVRHLDLTSECCDDEKSLQRRQRCSRFMLDFRRPSRDNVPERQPVIGLPFVQLSRPNFVDILRDRLHIADSDDDESTDDDGHHELLRYMSESNWRFRPIPTSAVDRRRFLHGSPPQ